MKTIAFILLIIVIVLLAVTNPTTADFKEYVSERIEEGNSSGTEIEGFVRELFSKPVSEMLAENTTRTNYYVVSVYSIPLDEKDNRYLGIAGMFFPLEESWKELVSAE